MASSDTRISRLLYLHVFFHRPLEYFDCFILGGNWEGQVDIETGTGTLCPVDDPTVTKRTIRETRSFESWDPDSRRFKERYTLNYPAY